MSLKDTVKNLRNILCEVASDLDKAENGNKAASQRVRTGTIRLEKVAKMFRKESIRTERNGGGSKKKKSPAKSSSAKSSSKAAPKKGKVKVKKAKGKSKSSAKRATAKILKKKK